jgi:adenylate kinase
LRAPAPERSASASGSRRIFGITGTPGTGKKSVAPLVAERLDLDCLGLNDLALSSGLAREVNGAREVDASALGRLVLRRLSRPAVVYGHLLPYSVPATALKRVVVLRCEPSTLKRRLRARGYPPPQVLENVEAELIGLISADSLRAYGASRVSELDTTSLTPAYAARSVVRLLRAPAGLNRLIDWSSNYGSGPRLRGLVSE